MNISIKSNLLASRQRLAEDFLRQYHSDTPSQSNQSDQARRYLTKHTQLIDQVLTALYNDFFAEKALTLLAVGGYGRAEMYPFSDIDILLLRMEGKPDCALEDLIGRFLQCLWDTGLHVGHAVRTLSECMQGAFEDVSIQTALLEARYLIGCQDLFQQLQQNIDKQCSLGEFIDTKIAEQHQRHQRYQNIDSPLEPNCKEAPGGLRDIHMLYWINRAMQFSPSFIQGIANVPDEQTDFRYTTIASSDLERNSRNLWEQWQTYGLLSEDEAQDMADSETFLRMLRIHLHLFCKRLNDKVLLNIQPDLAKVMTDYCVPTKSATSRLRPSEKMMKTYYRHVMRVLTINQLVLDSLQEMMIKKDSSAKAIHLPVQYLPYGLMIRSDRHLDFDDASQLQQHPEQMLKPFLWRYQYEQVRDIAPAVKRRIRSWSAQLASIRKHTVLRQDFLYLLQLPYGTTTTLRMLNRMGFLAGYLPVFGRIVGQMQHDLYHAYTVDQHILMVIRHLRRLMIKAFEHEYPEDSCLMAQQPKPWRLIVAALYHDIAKGRGANHSQWGRHEVSLFCRDHQLSKEDSEYIEWLVEDHLVMSQVAQHQDISDSNVLKTFAKRVQTQERLDALYLLTVADIRGTGPTVWTLWKGKLLYDLHQATRDFLIQQGLGDHQQQVKQSLPIRIMSILKKEGVNTSLFNDWWRGIHVDYLHAFEAETMAWHFRAMRDDYLNTTLLLKNAALLKKKKNKLDKLDMQNVVIDFPNLMVAIRREEIKENMTQDDKSSQTNTWLQLVVLASPAYGEGLFGRVCGHLAHLNYSVMQARIVHWKYGVEVLHFHIQPTKGRFTQSKMERLKTEMQSRLEQRSWPSALSTRLSQHVRYSQFQPQVQWRLDGSDRYIVSMAAVDRMGLLYDVSRFFLDWKVVLHHARINTLGYRAENTFVIECDALLNPRSSLQFKENLQEILKND